MGMINTICILLFALSAIHAAQQMKLDGGTFLIQNKVYPHAHLAMTNNKGKMVTWENKIEADQFWILKKSPRYSGYYYIYNAYREGWRVAVLRKPLRVGGYTGMFHPDQLWRFVDLGAGYYRIYNKLYKNRKLAKWGKENDEWGTFDGPNHNDQKWKLVPRYKADIGYKVLWSTDNRQGSKPFSETITITYGLKLTESSSISTKDGLEMSLKESASVGLEGVGSASIEMEQKIYKEITTSLSHRQEKNWSRESTIVFTAPAHKNYRVLQLYSAFRSPLVNDNLALRCDYRVEESDGQFNV